MSNIDATMHNSLKMNIITLNIAHRKTYLKNNCSHEILDLSHLLHVPAAFNTLILYTLVFSTTQ